MSPEGILTKFSSIIVRALLGRHFFWACCWYLEQFTV